MLHSGFHFFKCFERSVLRDKLVVSHPGVEILINISLREDKMCVQVCSENPITN